MPTAQVRRFNILLQSIQAIEYCHSTTCITNNLYGIPADYNSKTTIMSTETESNKHEDTLLRQKLQLCTNPLEPMPSSLRKVEGIERLKRAIQKELSCFLDEKCSNLPHLLSIVQTIQSPAHSQPSAVLKSFTFAKGKTGKLVADVVSLHGDEWCKVSARNPKSLQLLAAGGGGYGSKSMLDHGLEYLECAKENLKLFKPPKITFVFTSGIGVSLAEQLESIGVNVEGVRIEDSQLQGHERIKDYCNVGISGHLREEDSTICDNNIVADMKKLDASDNDPDSKLLFQNPDISHVTKLNLDITAMLAYVSNLTNGSTHIAFKKPILAEQRIFEIERPQKSVLDKVFEGRELYCCETAMKEFMAILNVVGGPEEKIRAKEFMKRITVVPDHLSEKSKKLIIGGHIKKRSLVIFGTGDYIKAVTVTANSGFVRSSKSQGVDFPAFIHESRALTEGKENYESKQFEKKQYIKSPDFLASELEASKQQDLET